MTDSVKAYLKQVRPIALLTAAEEIELSKRIKKGDKEAREQMIKANLRLVINIAKRYVNLGVPLSDLIEEGNIGLIKGVEKFDHKRGYRFSTYAVWWIKQSVSRAIIDQGKMIRVPVYMNEEILKYKKTVEKLTHRLKRKPRLAEIAKRMKLTVERVNELKNAVTRMLSLDAPIGGQEDGGQVIDVIEDENVASPDSELEKFFDKERTAGFLNMLDERERKIIEMRYGLLDDEPRTLAEIALELNVSRERIRQIEAASIKTIRQILNQEKLKNKISG